jgi:hypothetical protein
MDPARLIEVLDGADDATRARVWDELVAEVGEDEASRLWLEHFAATDAPKTG